MCTKQNENSIGQTILAAKRGFDGDNSPPPICLSAGNRIPTLLTKISKEDNIPFLSISLDEHTQEVGFYNRVEAFISLLEQRREQKI